MGDDSITIRHSHMCCFSLLLRVHVVQGLRLDSVQMESKDDSPLQMSGRPFDAHQERKTIPPTPNGRSSQSSHGMHSPALDYVRRTQTEAQEARVTARMRELMMGRTLTPDGARAKPNGGSSSSVESPEGQHMMVPPTAVRRNVTQRRSKGRATDVGDTAPMESLLTRRPRSRSKDRRYSLESIGRESPRIGAACESQDWRSASARFGPPRAKDGVYDVRPNSENKGVRIEFDDRENITGTGMNLPHLAYRVPSSTNVREVQNSPAVPSLVRRDTTAPFLKEYIPALEIHPVLHQALTQLWYERQEAVRGLGDALAQDDAERFNALQSEVSLINTRMHTTVQEAEDVLPYLNPGDYRYPSHGMKDSVAQGFDPSTASGEATPFSAQMQDTVTPPLQSSSREKDVLDQSGSDNGEDEERYLESDEWMESWKPDWWNTVKKNDRKKGVLKQSFKEDSQDVFQIQFAYQWVKTMRIVNDNMPMRSLFHMAISYLYTDFGFVIQNVSHIDLIYENQSLTTRGTLGSVPILNGAVIEIIYPRRMPSRNQNNKEDRGDLGRLTPGPQSQPSPKSHITSEMPATPIRKKEDLFEGLHTNSPSLDPRSYDKIRQAFRCPKFSGHAKEWKLWDKGFLRYLSIWELDYVLDPSFFDVLPLTPEQRRDNKLVYYVIEEAVQGSPLATSYVRQVAVNNGFEAYYTLHDGYVFAGTTTSALLLNDLSNFRFLPNETPTALCLRLDELFQELKDLPGDAAMTFNDTQQIGYLLNALRHEPEWDNVCSTITSKQIQGNITFRQACSELRFRCEAQRANEMMDRPIKGRKIKGLITTQTAGDKAEVTELAGQIAGLISTMSQRKNATDDSSTQGGKGTPGGDKKKKLICLAADCKETTYYPLCPLHYHSLISAKTPIIKLRNQYGEATFDATTSLIVYPPKTPVDRLPTLPKKVTNLASTPQ